MKINGAIFFQSLSLQDLLKVKALINDLINTRKHANLAAAETKLEEIEIDEILKTLVKRKLSKPESLAHFVNQCTISLKGKATASNLIKHITQLNDEEKTKIKVNLEAFDELTDGSSNEASTIFDWDSVINLK